MPAKTPEARREAARKAAASRQANRDAAAAANLSAIPSAKTLQSGYLVALSSKILGGPKYSRVDLETGKIVESGAEVSKWETTKEINDPAEYDRALKVRSKCRTVISAVCARSEFGLLCPARRGTELADAIREAREHAEAFNLTARSCRVEVYAIAGTIRNDDLETARAIRSEVRGLLEEMESGIAKADPKAIREAANKARQVGMMLTDAAAANVSAAILQARDAATEIVRRVGKAGEMASAVVADLKVDAISGARFSFLDLDEGAAEKAPIAGRSLDLELGDASPAPIATRNVEVL